MNYVLNEKVTTIISTVFCICVICPIVLIIAMKMFGKFKNNIFKFLQKFTAKKIYSITFALFLIYLIIVCTTLKIEDSDNYFIILDETLFFVAIVIVATGNYMKKNSVLAIEDFSKLNFFKDKLQSSMTDDKRIEHVVLWNKYLAYAVSFGLQNNISSLAKELLEITLDDDWIKITPNYNRL